MAKDKLISVIIPTFNRANYIEEAVNSVLSQTYDAIELIIIDDGSTDNTRQLLSEYGDELRYYRQDNQGIAAARNRGVTHATGDYLAFLDSDDIWMKDKLQRQMAVLEQIPQISVVYGHAEQFISPELDEETKRRFTHLDGKRLPSPMACGMLIPRQVFLDVGWFDESLNIGVEMDWYARMIESPHEMKMLPEVLFRRRLHNTNINITHKREQSERLHVLKKILDRRRNQNPVKPPTGSDD